MGNREPPVDSISQPAYMAQSNSEKVLFNPEPDPYRISTQDKWFGRDLDRPVLYLVGSKEWIWQNTNNYNFVGPRLQTQSPSSKLDQRSQQIKTKCLSAIEWISQKFSLLCPFSQSGNIPAPLNQNLHTPGSHHQEIDTSTVFDLNSPTPAVLELGYNDMLPEATHLHGLQNNAISALHRLPVELIMEIAVHLPPDARLMMQRVCSRFRNILAPHGVAPELMDNAFTMKLLFQVVHLLRRGEQLRLQEAYERECDAALENSQIRRFSCSGCRETHDFSSFSSHQLKLSPKTRFCKYFEGVVPLCDHFSFSSQWLLRGLREMKRVEVFCEMEHLIDSHGRPFTKCSHKYGGPRIGFHKGRIVTIDRIFPFFMVAEDSNVAQTTLINALRRRDAYICPHLRSSSPELFGGRHIKIDFPNHPSVSSEDLILRLKSPCHSRGNDQLIGEWGCVTWGECPHPDCITRYCVRRQYRHPHSGWVGLEVCCDMMNDPSHPTWQAQVVAGAACGGRCVGSWCLAEYRNFMSSQ